MQSMSYEELLGMIEVKDTSAGKRAKIPSQKTYETVGDFITKEVWQDSDTGKWRFGYKGFKRQGQAEKAARKEYERNGQWTF